MFRGAIDGFEPLVGAKSPLHKWFECVAGQQERRHRAEHRSDKCVNDSVHKTKQRSGDQAENHSRNQQEVNDDVHRDESDGSPRSTRADSVTESLLHIVNRLGELTTLGKGGAATLAPSAAPRIIWTRNARTM